ARTRRRRRAAHGPGPAAPDQPSLRPERRSASKTGSALRGAPPSITTDSNVFTVVVVAAAGGAAGWVPTHARYETAPITAMAVAAASRGIADAAIWASVIEGRGSVARRRASRINAGTAPTSRDTSAGVSPSATEKGTGPVSKGRVPFLISVMVFPFRTTGGPVYAGRGPPEDACRRS